MGVAQWLEHQVVALGAEGSSPFIHPLIFIKQRKPMQFASAFFVLYATDYGTACNFPNVLALKSAWHARQLLVLRL